MMAFLSPLPKLDPGTTVQNRWGCEKLSPLLAILKLGVALFLVTLDNTPGSEVQLQGERQ